MPEATVLVPPKYSVANRYAAAGRSRPYVHAAIVAALALAAAALVNRQLARKAERDNPPSGRFLEIDGVRLHYVERGEGPALVLLHGNGSMVEDFEASGLLEMAAREYRVIAFDRPGFGHSNRPRNVVWTPEAQAELIHKALERLGVSSAVVLGHSWGASVAIALALKYPEAVGGFGVGLRLLLSERSPRRRDDVAARLAGGRRDPEPNSLAHDRADGMAASYEAAVRAGTDAGQVRRLPEGNGPAPFPDPGERGRGGVDGAGRDPLPRRVR